VSAAAVYLVAKVGHSPRSPRDVTSVYAYLLSPSSSFFRSPSSPPPSNDPSSYYLTDTAYHSFHNRVLAVEARILYALSFNTHVSLPHPLAITYLQALEFLNTRKESISKRVVEYLNTALLSPQMLYLTSQPNALAVAAIYNAAKDIGAKMPECEWWEVFDVDREELGFLVVGMRSVDGWARKMREDLPKLKEGMITRKTIQEEMGRRGLSISNGHGQAPDMEGELSRRMDEKLARMEMDV
jgi:cyclin L